MQKRAFFDRALFLLALALPAGAAAASYTEADLLSLSQQVAHYEQARDTLLEGIGSGDAGLDDLERSESWRVRWQARVMQAWLEQPEACREAWEAQPGLTRAGLPRFTDATLQTETLVPVLLERVAHGEDTAPVRGALVELVSRSPGPWAETLVGLLAEEPDPTVRQWMVSAFRFAPEPEAERALRLGLADEQAIVRAMAARTAGWTEAGAEVADELVAALGRANADVRAYAASALGRHGVTSAFEALAPLLDDPVAEVRLQALRALSRLDEPRLATLPQVEVLESDEDERVARLAERIRG